MSENSGTNPMDPMESWRGMRDAAMDTWAKTMISAVNTDAYAQTTGAMLDVCLAAIGPYKEMLEKTMAQAAQQFGLPTRTDVINIADRLTNIELRLDDLDAKLDAALQRKKEASEPKQASEPKPASESKAAHESKPAGEAKAAGEPKAHGEARPRQAKSKEEGK